MTRITSNWPKSRLPVPQFSLTAVRWVTEIADPDDSGIVDDVEMFTVVGEQYRLDEVEAAGSALGESTGFLPPRFWLVHDNDNSHDSLAVAVYAIALDQAFHIGFLPKEQARAFRVEMEAIGRAGQSLEVLGCLTQGKSSPHPNGRIYLPVAFAELCQNGYVKDSANQVAWLKDESPVLPRLSKGSLADDFSFEELCKIFCWYAKKRRWFCFPDNCESTAEGLRSMGAGLPRADFAPFLTSSSAASLSTASSAPEGDMSKPPVSPSSQWFYMRQGIEAGPFTAEGLRSEAAAGRVGSLDQVRRGDLAKWVPADRVKGLFTGRAGAESIAERTDSRKPVGLTIESLLVAQHLLPPAWTAGELAETVPQMFEKLPPAEQHGYRRLFRDGKPSGGATAFVFVSLDSAKTAYKTICAGLGKGFGMVAGLGDEARFLYLLQEMPPGLNMPPAECSEIVFRRGTVVIHVRMMDCQPEPVVEYASRIDAIVRKT
jgi:hypothetical protein